MDAWGVMLQTIRQKDGFDTDAGANVFEWRRTALQDSELPALEYRDSQDEVSENTIQTWEHTLTIKVRISVKEDPPMPVIRKIIADILKAYRDDVTLETVGAMLANYVGDESDVEHVEYKYASSIVTITLRYLTDEWNSI
jgi:hypothetical protein